MANTPDLPNIIFRSYHGGQDIEAIHHIIHGCKDADGIDPYSTLENLPSPEQVEHDFSDTASHNAMIAEVNGQAVGYNRLIWWTEAVGLTLYLHLGHVLPEFRGKGIGTALLNWSEARIRELAAERGGKAMFGANASSTEHDATRLLLGNGYQPAFTVAQMEYLISDDLTPLPIPVGIEIRPPHPNDAAKMWRAQQAAYSEIPLVGVSAPDESEIEDLRKEIEDKGHLWRIAWAGDEIASEIWCSVTNYNGSRTGLMNEVHSVPQFQRKGIGRALIMHVLLMFKEMKIRRVRLHTLDDNRRGAKTFYTRIGFTTVKMFPRYRKPL